MGGARLAASFPQIQCGARPVRIIRNYRYDPLPGRRRRGLRSRELRESELRGAGYETRRQAVTLLVIAIFM